MTPGQAPVLVAAPSVVSEFESDAAPGTVAGSVSVPVVVPVEQSALVVEAPVESEEASEEASEPEPEPEFESESVLLEEVIETSGAAAVLRVEAPVALGHEFVPS